MIACSAPEDCAEIERRHATGDGLAGRTAASRGNLLSGEADERSRTVSRIDAEKRANPGYRAFLRQRLQRHARAALFGFEILLELTASLRAARRDVRPRGHRGGIYPIDAPAMCASSATSWCSRC